MKKFPKVASSYMNRIPKAADVDFFPRKPIYVATSGFRKPFCDRTSGFWNSFKPVGMWTPVAFGKTRISRKLFQEK